MATVWRTPVPLRNDCRFASDRSRRRRRWCWRRWRASPTLPFRAMCRAYGPDLVYVNEMVMATAVVHRNDEDQADDGVRPRRAAAQPADLRQRPRHARARRAPRVRRGPRRPHRPQLRVPGRQGHPKRRWRGGAGQAAPAAGDRARRGRAAAPYGVPVTAKFRMGLWDDLRTDITPGRCAPTRACAWIALHARTVEQHYSGEARWEAIGELKAGGAGIPVLGNGDIWEAADAVAMMRRPVVMASSSDVVASVGRGCSVISSTVLNGGAAPARAARRGDRGDAPPRPACWSSTTSGTAASRWPCATSASTRPGTCRAIRSDPRCAAGWRMVSSLAELDEILAELDPHDRDGRGRRADQARPHQRSDQGRAARRIPRRPRRARRSPTTTT